MARNVNLWQQRERTLAAVYKEQMTTY